MNELIRYHTSNNDRCGNNPAIIKTVYNNGVIVLQFFGDSKDSNNGHYLAELSYNPNNHEDYRFKTQGRFVDHFPFVFDDTTTPDEFDRFYNYILNKKMVMIFDQDRATYKLTETV